MFYDLKALSIIVSCWDISLASATGHICVISFQVDHLNGISSLFLNSSAHIVNLMYDGSFRISDIFTYVVEFLGTQWYYFFHKLAHPENLECIYQSQMTIILFIFCNTICDHGRIQDIWQGSGFQMIELILPNGAMRKQIERFYNKNSYSYRENMRF